MFYPYPFCQNFGCKYTNKGYFCLLFIFNSRGILLLAYYVEYAVENCYFFMIRLTKIFSFETAHALFGYDGACKDIHGHSYELHVTLTSTENGNDYIPAPGIAFDFKEIKRIVNGSIIKNLDHKLILSRAFLNNNPAFPLPENLLVWEAEPSAENILIYIKKKLCENLPNGINLVYLKLYETKNSYAELFIKS